MATVKQFYSYIKDVPIFDNKHQHIWGDDTYHPLIKQGKVINPQLEKPIKDIPLINLDSLPEFKFIDKAAFELEGAWLQERNDLHNDLSFSKEDFHPKYRSVGEYVSKPLDNLKDLITDLNSNWPDNSFEKCGFHIHFSLKSPAYYNVCMERKFYEEFIEMLTTWGKENVPSDDYFWHRLAGNNRYCTKNFIPDIQAAYKEKGHNRLNRRTILNYCYGYLKTIECRVLPMFKDKSLAISAVLAILGFVDRYIENNRLSKVSFNTRVIEKINIDNCEEKIILKNIDNNFKINRYNFFNKNKIVKSNKTIGIKKSSLNIPINLAENKENKPEPAF